MAEIDPTISDNFPSGAGELLRVTLWRHTGEIDIVPESEVSTHPDYPQEPSFDLPPNLEIYHSPRPNSVGKTFRAFREYYEALGPGTFELQQIGRQLGIASVMVWNKIKLFRAIFPEKVMAVGNTEDLHVYRTLHLGKLLFGEEARVVEPEEHERRTAHYRGDGLERRAAIREKQHMDEAGQRFVELQKEDGDKRDLTKLDHALLTIGTQEFSLDLTTIEGRLTLRAIEALKKVTSFEVLSNDHRAIKLFTLRCTMWENMPIAERRFFANDLRQLCTARGPFIDEHVRAIYRQLEDAFISSWNLDIIPQPHTQDIVVFDDPPIQVTYSAKPRPEKSSRSGIVIAPFPPELQERLPKEMLMLPTINQRKSK